MFFKVGGFAMAGFKKRQILSVFLSGIILLSVIAGYSKTVSAKDTGGKNAEKGYDVDTVFQELSSPLDGLFEKAAGPSNDDDFIENMAYSAAFALNGRYYVTCSSKTEGETKTLYSFDENGSDLKEISLPSHGENEWVSTLSVSGDGKIFLVMSEFSEDGLSSDSSLKMSCVDAGGREVWSKKIEGGEDLYAAGMVSAEDVTVLLTGTDVRIIQNKDGKEKKIPLPADDFYGNVCIGKDGSVLLSAGMDDGIRVWKLDTKKGTYDKQAAAYKNFYSDINAVSGAGSYDFFCAKENGIYGFTLDSSEPTLFLDYVASDLLISSAGSFAVMSDKSVLLTCYDEDDGTSLKLLKKVDSAKVAEKKIITLGCTNPDMELRKAVVDFNRNSKKYRISILEYPYVEEEDGIWASQLNTQIATGNIPDMICVNEEMPLQSYAAKGLFEDIGERFAKDPELSKNEYMMNVLDAFKIGGKMYFTVPSFAVIGLMGKQSDFQNTKGVTIAHLDKLISEKGVGYDTAMGIATRDSVLSWVMYYAMNQYVDWNAGTCSFDSDSFVKLLEFAARFPKKSDDDDSLWELSDGWVREGKQIVRDVNLYDFSSYMLERYGYFGEETVLMGYPGDGKTGPTVRAGSPSIAMSSTASDKDACWSFMREFYLDAYQLNIDFQFPVSKKILEAKAKKALEPTTYTYTDENGKEVTEVSHDSLFLGGKEIEIPNTAQADIDKVLKILESVDSSSVVDENITKIVTEETGAFFEGQKSALETAQIIQNRVKVYIAETK